jgi:hypothetical protein
LTWKASYDCFSFVFCQLTRSIPVQVLMIMLITLLNDGALISIGYDNVIANPVSEKHRKLFHNEIALVIYL